MQGDPLSDPNCRSSHKYSVATQYTDMHGSWQNATRGRRHSVQTIRHRTIRERGNIEQHTMSNTIQSIRYNTNNTHMHHNPAQPCSTTQSSTTRGQFKYNLHHTFTESAYVHVQLTSHAIAAQSITSGCLLLVCRN